ncbi:MAG: TldD/PmbA family protein [Candidatus Margulisiibacteriota bacterium]
MENREETFLDDVSSRLEKQALDNWDIYFEGSEDRHIAVRGGEVEDLKESVEVGYAIRLMKGQRISLVYGNRLDLDNADRLIEKALFVLKYMPPDEYFRMGDSVVPALLEVPCDSSFETVPISDKVQKLLDLESGIFAKHPAIKLVEHLGYSESRNRLAYRTKFSKTMFQESVYYGFGGEVIAQDGDCMEAGSASQYRPRYQQLDMDWLAREIAHEAYSMLNAAPLRTGLYPVVMRNDVLAQFLGTFGGLFSADKVQNHKSVLAGRKGEQIAPPIFTLTDDAILPDGLGTQTFDGEGSTAQRTVLIENGQLKEFLYDRKTAAREGRASTGNALRHGFGAGPVIGSTNLVVRPGTVSRETLLSRSQGESLYLTNVMGMHTANAVNGEFSVGATGYLVRAGVIQGPVKQFTIAGDILSVLGRIQEIANDVDQFPTSGNMICPSILISELSVSGA